MRIAVTGASGFAGRHLIQELLASGHEPYGFVRKKDGLPLPTSQVLVGDLCDLPSITALARHTPPFDACIHLGGLAFVPLGWSDPERVFKVNTLGTLHLLDAFRQNAPATRLVIVTSAEIYGQAPVDRAIREDDPPQPQNPYAIAKLAADSLALLYARRYGMPIIVARPANHIGPGQSPVFAISSFARQLAEIRAGRRAPPIEVGNLQSERCFLDVRDTVRAYRLLAERGQSGRAYNISAPNRATLEHVLSVMCEIAGVRPEWRIDPQRYRLTDRAAILDTTRIREDTGWFPTIPLSQTLRDILNEWINRITDEAAP